MGSLEGLREALEVDKALSLGQCQRHWGLGIEELREAGFYPVEAQIGLTRHQRPQPVVFVCSSGSIARLHPNQLRHLAGVAEMRQLLAAPAQFWRSTAERERALLIPDAIWETPEGSVAIEFDAGSYSPRQIEEKVWRFSRGYVQQIWGTPSHLRQARLESHAQGFTLNVVMANWL